MAEENPIYVVDLEADEGLQLRAHAAPGADLLVTLKPGQLVARLDAHDREGWWYLFADTPGEGAYVGYALARHLTPWSPAAVGPGGSGGDG